MPTPTATPPRPATPPERAQMEAARAEVRRVYAAARVKVEAINARPLLSSQEKAVLATARELGGRVDTWAGRYATWAQKGQRDDGSAYPLAMWLKHGRELAEAANYHAGLAWDATPFAVVASTVGATASTVGTALNPFAWPTWVKWSVGAGVVVVGLVLLRPYVKGAGAVLSAVRP